MPEPCLERALGDALARALERECVEVRALRPLGGGCINQAARIDTEAGTFFVKWSAAAPPDLFEREAEGLRELERAGSGLKIPRVLATHGPEAGRPGFIVMEYLEPRAVHSQADEEALGRGLAELHKRTAPRFGLASDSYCGATRQPNAWCADWPEFYASRRLRPLVESIAKRRGLSAAERSGYARLIARLPELLPTDAPPALIHGDLWSGNVLATTRGPALVDPACAYAEREMEFGITTLFGGLTPRAWSAYLEAFPLRPGWRERNPLYQLYHLLNHHLLFGGGYGAQALQIAQHFS